jgi:hypothetical protein
LPRRPLQRRHQAHTRAPVRRQPGSLRLIRLRRANRRRRQGSRERLPLKRAPVARRPIKPAARPAGPRGARGADFDRFVSAGTDRREGPFGGLLRIIQSYDSTFSTYSTRHGMCQR